MGGLRAHIAPRHRNRTGSRCEEPRGLCQTNERGIAAGEQSAEGRVRTGRPEVVEHCRSADQTDHTPAAIRTGESLADDTRNENGDRRGADENASATRRVGDKGACATAVDCSRNRDRNRKRIRARGDKAGRNRVAIIRNEEGRVRHVDVPRTVQMDSVCEVISGADFPILGNFSLKSEVGLLCVAKFEILLHGNREGQHR